MFAKIGTTELLVILGIALIIFGPTKLPQLGKMVGQAVGSFKKTVNTWEDELESAEEAIQKPVNIQPAKETERTDSTVTETIGDLGKGELA